MDSLPFIDALIKEYLLFRGFTQTLQTFSRELSQDQGCGYQADSMTQLLFGRLIPECSMNEVLEFLDLLNSRLYVHLDSRYDATIRKLEQSIIKCLLVTAIKKKRKDKVEAFFHEHGDDLLHGPDGGQWRPWCALAFIPQPWQDPAFQAFFLPSWHQLLELSFHNFLTEVTARLPLPSILRFNTDRRLRLQLTRQVEQLQQEVRHLNQHKPAEHSLGSKASRAAMTQWPEEEVPENQHQPPGQRDMSTTGRSAAELEPQAPQALKGSGRSEGGPSASYSAAETGEAASGAGCQQGSVVDAVPSNQAQEQPSGSQARHGSQSSIELSSLSHQTSGAGDACTTNPGTAANRKAWVQPATKPREEPVLLDTAATARCKQPG